VSTLARWKIPIALGVLAVMVVAFLAFRPDKLFVDDAVDESLDEAFAPAQAVADDPAQGTTAPTTTAPAGSASTTPPEAEPANGAGPRAVSAGSFSGIDHRAAGSATVYEQDGRYVLRFEDDTDIQNGPDLYVWVLADDTYTGGTPSDYLDLGKIKGNVGGQNYELPDGFDPAVHRTVLVWCLRFNVPFAMAPLA